MCVCVCVCACACGGEVLRGGEEGERLANRKFESGGE